MATDTKAKNPETAPEPILAPVAADAPIATAEAPKIEPGANDGRNMKAREPWSPPTSLQLAESLRELTEDKGRHEGLLRMLNKPLVHVDPGFYGKPGKFLSTEDWRNIVWAVQAWLTLMGLPEELEQKADSKKAKDLAETVKHVRNAAGKRAAKIWNPK